jgi:hypothetical protein
VFCGAGGSQHSNKGGLIRNNTQSTGVIKQHLTPIKNIALCFLIALTRSLIFSDVRAGVRVQCDRVHVQKF